MSQIAAVTSSKLSVATISDNKATKQSPPDAAVVTSTASSSLSISTEVIDPITFAISTSIIGGITSYVLTTSKSPIRESIDEVNDTTKEDTISPISSRRKSRLKTTGLGLLALATTAIIVRYIDHSSPLVLQGIRSIQIDMKSYILLTVIVGGIASFQLINSEQGTISEASSIPLSNDANRVDKEEDDDSRS